MWRRGLYKKIESLGLIPSVWPRCWTSFCDLSLLFLSYQAPKLTNWVFASITLHKLQDKLTLLEFFWSVSRESKIVVEIFGTFLDQNMLHRNIKMLIGVREGKNSLFQFYEWIFGANVCRKSERVWSCIKLRGRSVFKCFWIVVV